MNLIKAEIFQQRIPCVDCPFRKVGGIRHERRMMASYVRHFTTEPGATFPCHRSVPAADPRTTWSAWQDGEVLCAGGLLFAAKLGTANGITRLGTELGWYSQTQHTEEEKALVFDSVAEMLDAAV